MRRVLVASPRSFCAGVVRAIDIVERLLERHGPPVYVRHEIVHNVHVVEVLEARGAVFVKSEDDVPEGAIVVLSFTRMAPSTYNFPPAAATLQWSAPPVIGTGGPSLHSSAYGS